MKILELEIEGFRSLKKAIWTPRDLNVVIGPNASGKSNLLQLLELIAVSARRGLGKYVQREGGMVSLAWDGTSQDIRIRIKTSPLDPDLSVERGALTYLLAMARLGGTSAYRIEHELLGNYRLVETGEEDEPFKLIERDPRHAVIFDEQQKSLTAPDESIDEEETLLSIAAGPFMANRWILRYQEQLSSWSVYQGLDTGPDSSIRQPAVTRRESVIAPDGENLISVLHTLYSGDMAFKHNIDDAMTAAFGEEYEGLYFPPAADQSSQMRIGWKGLEKGQPAPNLSDGTLWFLFLMAIMANPEAPSLIAIDEPETGLHPSMMSIIAEYAVEASGRTQVVLTTHSPDFLDAFRDVKPTTTVLQLVDGETDMRVLSGDGLKYWLDRYSLGEVYRTGELEAMEAMD